MNRKPYNKLEKEDHDLVGKHIGGGDPAQIRTALFNNMSCFDVGEGCAICPFFLFRRWNNFAAKT
jgi:hypothetical protein